MRCVASRRWCLQCKQSSAFAINFWLAGRFGLRLCRTGSEREALSLPCIASESDQSRPSEPPIHPPTPPTHAALALPLQLPLQIQLPAQLQLQLQLLRLQLRFHGICMGSSTYAAAAAASARLLLLLLLRLLPRLLRAELLYRFWPVEGDPRRTPAGQGYFWGLQTNVRRALSGC